MVLQSLWAEDLPPLRCIWGRSLKLLCEARLGTQDHMLDGSVNDRHFWTFRAEEVRVVTAEWPHLITSWEQSDLEDVASSCPGP